MIRTPNARRSQPLKHSILCTAATLVVLANAAGPAFAQEAARSAAAKASAVADKTAHAVKRGVDKTSSAVQHGGKKTSEAIRRGGNKIGLPMTPASSPQPAQ
jgi:hypothetical protein